VHLDPVGSERPSASDLSEFETELIGREGREDRDDNEPNARAREGLPKRFRMRHGRHYVDELLGETPLRTVREIPISEIEPPPDEAINLELMEASIRQFGVIEPLLVGRRGLQYRVITGMRRLRAARTVGLSTVPCLVEDVDDQKLSEMREAATRPIPSSVIMPCASTSTEEPTTVAVQDSDLRATVSAQLADAELLREKIASAAADYLMRSSPFEPAPASCAGLIGDAVAGVSLEARLRGTQLAISPLPTDCQFSLDGPLCRMALTALLSSILSLANKSGSVLELCAQVTTIRPALLVQCQMRGSDGRGSLKIADQTLPRFFDADWKEHPCGAEGAVMLAAVAKVARAHGGRVQVQSEGLVTFVVPRPLTDF
jgi:hypothetical protein